MLCIALALDVLNERCVYRGHDNSRTQVKIWSKLTTNQNWSNANVFLSEHFSVVIISPDVCTCMYVYVLAGCVGGTYNHVYSNFCV